MEAVLVPMKGGRTTLCVSTQVGCAMACAFCATGTLGLARDLTAMSFPEIARGLGRSAHSAVHGAWSRVQGLVDADARIEAGPSGEIAARELVARLRHTLRAHGRH